MQTIILRNGYEVVASVAVGTLMLLQRLAESDPLALYEIAMKSSDPARRIEGTSKVILERLSLLQTNGAIHDDVRQVILHAVADHELDVLPFATPHKKDVLL